jgi:hypothetical protein
MQTDLAGAYFPGRVFGAEVEAAGFFAGVEMPKLMRKKRKPFRRVSRILIASILSSPADFDSQSGSISLLFRFF